MNIGIAFDLKSDYVNEKDKPIDYLEELDEAVTVTAIEQAIRTLGHQPHRLGGGRRFIENILTTSPDLVFNIAEGHGTRSREAHIPSVLEMLDIPFTHSDPQTLNICMDKALSKKIARASGIPTPDFRIVSSIREVEEIDLAYPLIAKVVAEGSSIGVRLHSKVMNREELIREIDRLLTDYRQPVLVERFCPGTEITVGIACIDGVAKVIGVMEIAPRVSTLDSFIYSLEVKRDYRNQVDYFVPPRLSAPVIAEVEEIALAAFHTLECRDVARIDFRCDENGKAQFIEINPLPGLNPLTSDLIIMARQKEIPYERLIGWIIDSAIRRNAL